MDGDKFRAEFERSYWEMIYEEAKLRSRLLQQEEKALTSLEPVSQELVSHAQELTRDVEVNLDEPLDETEELEAWKDMLAGEVSYVGSWDEIVEDGLGERACQYRHPEVPSYLEGRDISEFMDPRTGAARLMSSVVLKMNEILTYLHKKEIAESRDFNWHLHAQDRSDDL